MRSSSVERSVPPPQDVHERIKEIEQERIAKEFSNPDGRPLEVKQNFEKLRRDLIMLKSPEVPPFLRIREAAKKAVLDILEDERLLYTEVSDIDTIIEGVVARYQSREDMTPEQLREFLKKDSAIQIMVQTKETQRLVREKQEAKKLFLEVYTAEVEVTESTNIEGIKEVLKKRLRGFIEEVFFEEFWREVISSEDFFEPFIQPIEKAIANREVRESLCAVFRKGDFSEIVQFLGKEAEVLKLAFPRESLPTLRFILSQAFEKQLKEQNELFATICVENSHGRRDRQKEEEQLKKHQTFDLQKYIDNSSFFIQFCKFFPQFTPLATELFIRTARSDYFKKGGYFLKRSDASGYEHGEEKEERIYFDSIRFSLKELYDQYVDQLPPLSEEDRKIVDRVKKVYFSREHPGNYFFSRNWNKFKTFDGLRMKQLIRRATLEIFQLEKNVYYFLGDYFQELGFITDEQRSVIEHELDKDYEMQFLEGRYT